MNSLNPGLPPFKCAFCEIDAVCGIYQKSQPGLVINVCVDHLWQKTGKVWQPKEDTAMQGSEGKDE